MLFIFSYSFCLTCLVFSELYAVARSSVRRLSVVCLSVSRLSVVCNARAPYLGDCNFWQFSTAFDTLLIH